MSGKVMAPWRTRATWSTSTMSGSRTLRARSSTPAGTKALLLSSSSAWDSLSPILGFELPSLVFHLFLFLLRWRQLRKTLGEVLLERGVGLHPVAEILLENGAPHEFLADGIDQIGHQGTFLVILDDVLLVGIRPASGPVWRRVAPTGPGWVGGQVDFHALLVLHGGPEADG